MRRYKWLLIISVVSLLLIALGLISLYVEIAYLALTLGGFGIGLGLIAWLYGMIYTVTSKLWGWFTAILITGPIGAFIYALSELRAHHSGAQKH